MNSRVLVTAMVGALLLSLGTALWAAECCPTGKEIRLWGGDGDKPKVNENFKPDTAVIGIGRFEILTIKTPAVGVSVAEREVIIYNRLCEILSNGPVNPGAVCVGKVRSAPTVFVGPYRLISAYPQDATVYKMSTQQVAEMWAKSVAAIIPLVAPTNEAVKCGVGNYNAPWKQAAAETPATQ